MNAQDPNAPQSGHEGGSHRRPPRRPAPLAVAGRTVAIGLSLAVFGTCGFTWYTYHSLTTGMTTSSALDTVKQAAPPRPTDTAGHLDTSVNVLLIGLDSRRDQDGNPVPQDILENELHAGSSADIGGYNTNTLILMHIPANGGKVEAFSIPRDDYVDLINAPGKHPLGKHKIKEAYDRAKYYAEEELSKQGVTDPVELEHRSREAGRQATLLTVQNMLQVPIDHFAEVNLLGFYHVAQALNGIDVCLKKPASDPIVARTATHAGHGSGADFPAGQQHLNASQALSFVRQRYNLPNGDLDRTKRQQAFLAGATKQLKDQGVFGDLGKLQQLIDVAKKDVVIDDGWNVLDFAQQVPNLTGGNVEFHTLGAITDQPNLGGDDGDVNIVDVPKARAQVHQTIGDTDASPSAAAGTSASASAAATSTDAPSGSSSGTTSPASPSATDAPGGGATATDAPSTTATDSPSGGSIADDFAGDSVEGGQIPCVY
ncbi:LCP family protein required for cell wall assembly [Kitasatospora sp. GP30]|uniref:LCP family protein n=1 Tax=Kitasatospora sp. GP30 TaxID=3035084 RepID=UPI000CAE034A|nr:LCP family protein [Kitasatospora sp. GP30]MDH6142888.1 LCP family protein required for cell wall assembly [Kitasatospora sp. GP30]